MRKLKLYRVIRYMTRPHVVVVFAYDKDDANVLVGKKYGPDSCEATSMRIKRGFCIEEIGRR